MEGGAFNKNGIIKLINYFKKNRNLPNFKNAVHSKFNILGLSVHSGLSSVVKIAFEEFGYHSYLFRKEMDPINIALNLDNPAVLDTLAAYLEDSGDLDAEITQEIFIKGTNCSSKKFRELVIHLAFLNSQTYGVELQNAFPTDRKEEFYKVLESDSISKDFSF